MKNNDIFREWAPDESPWSLWAKPVLFIGMIPFLGESERIDDRALPELRSIPRRSNKLAIVVDLAGESSVRYGLSIAHEGYRPVPLFNGAVAPAAIVNTIPIVQALISGVRELRRLMLPAEAPPVFLLDANRLSNADQVGPNRFDNRWCLFPQDMPSASRLKEAGISQVMLVAEKLGEDLAHVLRRYELAGLQLSWVKPEYDRSEPLSVPRPSNFGRFWYRLGVIAGLRRNAAGGFGAVVPDPQASGGGFS